MKSFHCIGAGEVRCILKPGSQQGLEGYQCGETYRFKRMKDHAGEYFRVFSAKWLQGVYDTTTINPFKRFFQIENERRVGA